MRHPEARATFADMDTIYGITDYYLGDDDPEDTGLRFDTYDAAMQHCRTLAYRVLTDPEAFIDDEDDREPTDAEITEHIDESFEIVEYADPHAVICLPA